jgi:ubiquinone/menaquinone biosynthesis C-methylase UbiE
MLERVLEPEVMDTAEEAQEYNEMNHADVNRVFVDDLLATGSVQGDILDLGTGTALIPIELCQRVEDCRVMAADLSIEMLEMARFNLEVNNMTQCVQLEHIDAKELPNATGMFNLVISNSIVHHIPEPAVALAEAVRVTAAGGRLFFRDLFRPRDNATVEQLVATYMEGESEQARALFDQSLRAALTVEEMQELVVQLGFAPETVTATSDRHWTWSASKPE